MSNKLISIIFLTLLVSCNNDDENNIKSDYTLRYLQLIKSVENDLYKDSEMAMQEYKHQINIPSQIIKLEYTIVKIATITYNKGFDKPYYFSWPDTLVFDTLANVYDNNLVFLVSPGPERRNIIYNTIDSSLLTNNIPDRLFNRSNEIYYDNKWYVMQSNYSNHLIIDQGESFTTIDDYNNIPLLFKNSNFIGPVVSDKVILRSSYSINYKNGDSSYDIALLYYNWKTQESYRICILPFLIKYQDLDFNMTGIRTIDKKNRIYFAFHLPFVKSFDDLDIINTKQISSGHIIIYDIENDILYNLHHPYWDKYNTNERLLGYQYALGDDDNIYYQLVTEKAYYIYKITPSWEQSAQRDEYKPYFFEYYPNLKSEFENTSIITN